MKLEIYKNFLEKDFFYKLKETILDLDFPWRFRPNMTPTDKDKEESFYFTFSFFNNLQINSNLYCDYILPILKKIKCIAPIEVRANMTLKKDIVSGWHMDRKFLCKTAILYLNTCNGGTELKIKNKTKFIPSEENKIIIFDSNILHRGIVQNDVKRRIFLNFNYF